MPTINRVDTGQNRQQGVKNFLKALTNLGDIQGNEVRLKSQLLANQFEKKQNFLYKIQEKLQENQMTQDLMNKINQEQGGMSIGSPEIRAGAGGTATPHYPDPAEQKMRIQQKWAQIDKKQANNMPLNDIERKFTEDYPKEMLGGKENQPFTLNKGIEVPQGYETIGYDSKGNPMVRKIESEKEKSESKQFEEDIKIKLSQGESLIPEEINYYNKFMWRTGEEMKMSKKEKTKYGEFYIGQIIDSPKGKAKYQGNNVWKIIP